MTKTFLILLTASTVWAQSSLAQAEDARLNDRNYTRGYKAAKDTLPQKRPMGKIKVIEDGRITALDELKTENPGLRDGYRVQIFFGKRKEALEQKAKFTNSHPDMPTYISYLAPNFRLRVGDFRTRIEGEKLKQEIDTDYPGCYLVKDKIELPRLDQPTTN